MLTTKAPASEAKRKSPTTPRAPTRRRPGRPTPATNPRSSPSRLPGRRFLRGDRGQPGPGARQGPPLRHQRRQRHPRIRLRRQRIEPAQRRIRPNRRRAAASRSRSTAPTAPSTSASTPRNDLRCGRDGDRSPGAVRKHGLPSGAGGINPYLAVDQASGHVLEYTDGPPATAREYDAAGGFVAEFGNFTEVDAAALPGRRRQRLRDPRTAARRNDDADLRSSSTPPTAPPTSPSTTPNPTTPPMT